MRLLMIALAAGIGLGPGPSVAQTQIQQILPDTPYEGRIRLARFLDEPDGYCLDIPGSADRQIPNVPMWVHTCHMFPRPDQVVTVDPAAGLSWQAGGATLCLTAAAIEENAEFSLAPCDGRPEQRIAFTASAQMQLADSELCLHVASFGPSPFGIPTSNEDEYGRGIPINPPVSHLARPLVALPCAAGDPGFSRWVAMPEFAFGR